MKKTGSAVYLIGCLLLCVLPFAGMFVAPTNTTTENRKMAEFPKLKEDTKWNQKYLQELGLYFEDHFAFRNILVTADSVIQSKVFRVSNMNTAVVGEDGWLYYAATLDDYLKRKTLSERGIQNAVRNLSMMQSYLEDKGAEFWLTIAPNKNSLYGDNMPYYEECIVGDTKNIDVLQEEFENRRIHYADLFDAFQKENEILYLKQDSHWSEKGAVLAYHTILDTIGYSHETYEMISNIRTKTEYGDLNRMLYPEGLYPEWNYTYEKEHAFSYVTETKSVEDAWIETVNDTASGSMLMFRDSFGNTLLPYFADTFKNAYFSKSVPYNLEEYINSYHPEYVILEKVERNIDDFAKEPPIITGREVSLDKWATKVSSESTIETGLSEYNTKYFQIFGKVDEAFLNADSKVYVSVRSSTEHKVYEAFTISDEESDNGYLVYFPKDRLPIDEITIDIFVEKDGELLNVQEAKIQIGLIEYE